ncbi:MAG: tripartite tricarboxylate transporter TctB family protein [Methylobacteriaceae bacterium]|jgi:hypothetical protein|nr:tripartite tricarboxylate transporter TctB family protein [Methylobacteriaceae bacterium]
MVNWKQDFALSVALLALAAAFYGAGAAYPADSFLFPSFLSPVLAVLSVLLGVSALKRRAPGAVLVDVRKLRGPAFLVVLTALFIVILPYMGFIPSCFLLSATFFLGMNHPNKAVALGVALVASVGIWAVFHLALDVSLPVGSLWETY